MIISSDIYGYNNSYPNIEMRNCNKQMDIHNWTVYLRIGIVEMKAREQDMGKNVTLLLYVVEMSTELLPGTSN